MKKGLILTALVLMIATSLIAGTLANYTTTIDALASGSVVAKEFILLESGTDTFESDVKIAPTETETWSFAVKNYNGAVISETAMDLDYTISVSASDGKSAIEPLIVSVVDSTNAVVATRTGAGTMTFDSGFSLDAQGQEEVYTVVIEWPSNDTIDINYAGSGFGSTVSVSVTGMQE
jgi:hypothetical protein